MCARADMRRRTSARSTTKRWSGSGWRRTTRWCRRPRWTSCSKRARSSGRAGRRGGAGCRGRGRDLFCGTEDCCGAGPCARAPARTRGAGGGGCAWAGAGLVVACSGCGVAGADAWEGCAVTAAVPLAALRDGAGGPARSLVWCRGWRGAVSSHARALCARVSTWKAAVSVCACSAIARVWCKCTGSAQSQPSLGQGCLVSHANRESAAFHLIG